MKKKSLVIGCSWLVFIVIASLLWATPSSAAASFQRVEQTVFPQAGCRCCWFRRTPLLVCGKACCIDGCCSLP
ncbi:hypothetical protein BT93_F0688 [Corymbia citriodora subsp. variegata]|nr:hypothetical protein BT93_F0688 [Corymbia citriodora subsp. variegata]